jgi:hypothetical protein
MPISYAVDAEHMTVRLTASNPLTTADFDSYYRVSRLDSRVSPDMDRIVDFRGIGSMPACADVVRVARSRREAPIGPHARVAVIVDSDLAYGVSMQFAAHAGMLDDQLHAFRSESEAAAWIDHRPPITVER